MRQVGHLLKMHSDSYKLNQFVHTDWRPELNQNEQNTKLQCNAEHMDIRLSFLKQNMQLAILQPIRTHKTY
jgi:hypothetical protein